MNFRQGSYLLIGIALAVLLVSGLALLAPLAQWRQNNATSMSTTHVVVQPMAMSEVSQTPTPQVRVGTPEFYDKPVNQRYTYRNERLEDRTKWRPLYLIDTQTGQETRLGDDSHGAAFGTMNEEYLLWFFDGDLHAYHLATETDQFIAELGAPLSIPQIAEEWAIFGEQTGDIGGTLYAANLETQEVITLTQRFGTQGDGGLNAYFGISPYLAAWFEPPETIVVYDLHTRRELTRLVDLDAAFNERYVPIFDLTPGQTIVTWGSSYGYDLVTQSYFRITRVRPPGAEDLLLHSIGRAREENRMIYWELTLTDITRRSVRAPLLDATPSTAPCITNQNLVQNGDFEDADAHSLWQQQDNIANLLINDAPPGLASGGAWAIRLGRFADNHAAIRQRIEIPSGVSGLTLTFDVRALSWDFWGGDHLQVDLIDPLTGNSLLATPVQWTNVQLASGDWLPMQVTIEPWPGINTPVDLVFAVQTDWALPSDFTIDNIQLMTICQ